MTDADHIELEDEPASEEPLLPNGTMVDDKYTIQRALGRGGTGTVYEAQHAVIGHRIALKIVNAARAERPETLARFQREARICGTIRHPNVGQIYDVGMHDGKPYMVLELHEGQSLADVLEESVLPIPATIEITLQVLSALAAIHDVNVVHRDVKPDNVMLVRSISGDIVVKLVDFGISKVISTDISERTLTREGSILGSPDYMSPEQLRGQSVDARTDLYAVGVLLYEAIAGSTPFDAENLSDLMVAILRDSVLPPRELRGDCPVELEALTLKALSRDPAERFQSAVEMARQLEHVRTVMRYTPDPSMSGLRKRLPPRADRVTRARRASRKPAAEGAPAAVAAAPLPQRASKRSRALGVVIAALVSAIALVILIATRQAPAPEPAPEPAPAPDAAPSAAAPADAVPSASPIVIVAPAALEADAAVVDPEQTQASSIDPPPKAKRDRRPTGNTKAAADAQDQLAEASSAFVLGQMPRAKALYQEILDRSPRQADAWRGLGLVSSRMGQRKDAERAFERYLELRPNAPDAGRIREQLEKVR
jgi:serine/threonine-protein kinase